MKPSKNPDVLESASAIKRRLQRVVGTPRYDELRDSLMLLVGRTTVTYHVEQWMSHAKELEVELNGALDKLEKLGSANAPGERPPTDGARTRPEA